MTPTLPRITENMAAFWRSRGRLASSLLRAVRSCSTACQRGECMSDRLLATPLHRINITGCTRIFLYFSDYVGCSVESR